VPPREHGRQLRPQGPVARIEDLISPVYCPAPGSRWRPAFSQVKARSPPRLRSRWQAAAISSRCHQGRLPNPASRTPFPSRPDHAELQGLPDLRMHRGRTSRPSSITSTCISPRARPRETRINLSEVRLFRRAAYSIRHPPARATSPAWSRFPNACAIVVADGKSLRFQHHAVVGGYDQHIKATSKCRSHRQLSLARDGYAARIYHPAPLRVAADVYLCSARKQMRYLRISLQRWRPVQPDGGRGECGDRTTALTATRGAPVS